MKKKLITAAALTLMAPFIIWDVVLITAAEGIRRLAQADRRKK